jgi:hypothetical protein
MFFSRKTYKFKEGLSMTGAYLRVKRNDKYENVEIEYLTDEEIDEVFGKAENEEMRRWIKFLVNQLYSIATFIDKEPFSD